MEPFFFIRALSFEGSYPIAKNNIFYNDAYSLSLVKDSSVYKIYKNIMVCQLKLLLCYKCFQKQVAKNTKLPALFGVF